MRRLSLLFGTGVALLLSGRAVLADDAVSKPHIGNGPAVEKSVPNSAPAATTTRTTGASDQDKAVKGMNDNEKAKINATGK